MPKAVFEPAVPTNERLQTHTLDRAVTGQLKFTGNPPLFWFEGHKNCTNTCREQWKIF